MFRPTLGDIVDVTLYVCAFLLCVAILIGAALLHGQELPPGAPGSRPLLLKPEPDA